MKGSVVILFLLSALLSEGCQERRGNDQADIDRTKIRMEDYYADLGAKNYDLLSQQFAVHFTREKLLRNYEKLDSIYGDFVSYTIDEITTDITVVNDNDKGTSVVRTTCTYTKQQSSEFFVIVWNGSETYIDEWIVTAK